MYLKAKNNKEAADKVLRGWKARTKVRLMYFEVKTKILCTRDVFRGWNSSIKVELYIVFRGFRALRDGSLPKIFMNRDVGPLQFLCILENLNFVVIAMKLT